MGDLFREHLKNILILNMYEISRTSILYGLIFALSNSLNGIFKI